MAGLEFELTGSREAVAGLVVHDLVNYAPRCLATSGDQGFELVVSGGFRFHGEKHWCSPLM
jgi:hypothetical protein